jgi:CTP synthase
VIDLLPEQRAIKDKGATMRLGAWKCELAKGTRAFEAYGKQSIEERHRHRYEVNNDYLETLEKSGLVIAGISRRAIAQERDSISGKSGHIVEMVEWREPHGFGIGLQAHPEYKSRLEEPAPLFVAFVKAALERKKK